jgi:hypothetical protein
MSRYARGLNWSAQHLRKVYAQQSRSPKFFADVDFDAARSCPVGLRVAGKVGSLRQVLTRQAVGVFVRSSLPGAVRISEVDFHIRGYREGFVFSHLQPAIPRQRSPQGRWKPMNLPGRCGDDRAAVSLLRTLTRAVKRECHSTNVAMWLFFVPRMRSHRNFMVGRRREYFFPIALRFDPEPQTNGHRTFGA